MQERVPWASRPLGRGFVAGLAAGAVASGVMLFLHMAPFNGLSLPESFGSELTALMPGSMFAFLHQFIGDYAKSYLFYIILVGQCLVFALGGGLYNRWANQQDQPLPWYHGLLLALILWLFSGLILLPLTGAGIFGAGLTVGWASGAISLAIVGVAFGLLFVFCQRWLLTMQSTSGNGKIAATRENATQRISRRKLFQQGAVVAGVAVAGVAIWRFISVGFGGAHVSVTQLLQGYHNKITPTAPNYGEIHPAQFLSPEVTPNDQYYIVSKNFTDPTVGLNDWSLKVDGLVDHPYTLSYTELLAMPMQKQYESMMCISNEVGGSYMSNALWEGVQLENLLQRAGVKPGATKIVLHAYDDYADSIHLSKAIEPTTMVAVHMNGVKLPDGHGYPARVLVPGIYGMKHIKWLTHIEVVNYDFQGYWQVRGWNDPAPVRLTSRIDTPLDGVAVAANNTTYVAGVAFSGNKGISAVEVSLDAGHTWQLATLKKPVSEITWVIWELPWQPKPGQYTITVRATDMDGNVQDPNEEPPLPIGSSGYHSIGVPVS
ncbi:MAG: molybdopterin-dependent oxidoreductase [Ktedonobacteraceae bacterium]